MINKPLSWNEIKERSALFVNRWIDNEKSENAESQTFWNEFFYIFGIDRKSKVFFEHPIINRKQNTGHIDGFWPGVLLIEHKSIGKNLESAYAQSIDYVLELKEEEVPKYILVSDFKRFKLYDILNKHQHEFNLEELKKHVELFYFISGHNRAYFEVQDPVNIKAAELMGELHDSIELSGYIGHNLELYLVRLLFCLFSDDADIFDKNLFQNFLKNKTSKDGSDLGPLIEQVFQILNTPKENRLLNLDHDLAKFPYVNGGLFNEKIPIASFDSKMRLTLLKCGRLDWSKISPAIFGSMFQSVMNPKERRNLGAHYTSETNILKLIKPLFLDDLYIEFNKILNSSNPKGGLRDFHKKLSSLKFLDPACGCGNFLIITYRELRILELKVLKSLYGNQQAIGIDQIMHVDVDQFYGIEIDEFPARIAEVAMWLIDHQMNIKVGEFFGKHYLKLPLKKSATIVHGNALRIEWTDIVPKSELSYILGNPPFIGSKLLDQTQRIDMINIFKDVKNCKILDYVSAWHYKAAQYIHKTNIKTAFVSTNSVTQGEQVSVLWDEMIKKLGIKIHFAHTTFKWSNQAKGKAAVYCVIIGYANVDTKKKKLFTYLDINGEPFESLVKNINPYLVNAEDLIIERRSQPICNVPKMAFGNMPLDGGNLIIEDDEKLEFLLKEPKAKPYVLPLISAKEYLNNKKRWCLWLENITPNELRKMPKILERVQAVKQFRLASKAPSTQKHAITPTLFRDRNRPNTFIVVPRVSSEKRKYIPMGFFDHNSIVSDTMLSIPNGNLFNFGILMSEMHMSWVKYTCGRLKSDYRYSKDIVYNNYPWPKELSEKNKKNVEAKAQKILDVRKEFSESSLADLYDPDAMPPKLTKAHRELDKAVDKCYRSQLFKNDSKRIEFLFNLHIDYIDKRD